ncbi:MAG: DHHA1 domain-containing protein [Bacillus sp. (in: Bacteria)]|nr:DHHA1 domain-containing protein [Bacillus sp. (in: firmicutes)]
MLNSPGSKLAEAVSRIVTANKELEKKVVELEGKILEIEGKTLLEIAEHVNEHLIVAKVFQNRTMQELQKLGKFIVENNGQAIVIAISENGEQIQLVCGRGNEGHWNMQTLIKELLPLIDGRGGGSPAFAQGGGIANVTGLELLDVALRLLQSKRD